MHIDDIDVVPATSDALDGTSVDVAIGLIDVIVHWPLQLFLNNAFMTTTAPC
jgi:hypothetical protein